MMPTPTPKTAVAGPLPWRRALITGGAGFLGSHLTTRLLDSGVEVDCLDDLSTGRAGNVQRLAGRAGFRFLQLDVADPDCRSALTGPYDLVLHLAGPAAPADCRRSPLRALDAASLGTRNALAVADRDGARFLLVSAGEACPPNGNGHPDHHTAHLDRADPVGPVSAFAESKRFAETLVAAHAAAHGSNAGIVRVYDTCGPGMRPDDGRTVSGLVARAMAGRPVTVPADGHGALSLCYVDDAVDGLLLVAAGRSVRPVDIGGEEAVPVGRIARRVIELTGSRAPLRFVDGVDGVGGAAAPRPDTGFARELFGWAPRVTWQEGLARTLAPHGARRHLKGA
ncbi:NAD-dependent epimerase/dehydratase family protein [Streptomyces griseosporeus]|uniref:NAD-dependent epimerase/dehydratase family protein n=1 Tax=Streptomyces griseosporeus TaxID=1910 RepID=UPI0036F6446B